MTRSRNAVPKARALIDERAKHEQTIGKQMKFEGPKEKQMSKRLTLAIVLLSMIGSATSATAVTKSTVFCGVTSSVPVDLEGLLFLGERFRATVKTNDVDANPTPDACVTGPCGMITALAAGQDVSGSLDSISTTATTWSSTGTLDAFEVLGNPASGTIVASIDGTRFGTPTIHPNLGTITDGGATISMTVLIGGNPVGPVDVSASIKAQGEECDKFVPALPVWGFPLLGIGMLASAGFMVRKRA